MSLILVFALSAGVVANAAFPSSDNVYLDTSQPVTFRSGTTTIGSVTAVDQGGSVLNYVSELSVNRTIPTTLTTSFYLQGNQYFPGGRTYNFYASGNAKATSVRDGTIQLNSSSVLAPLSSFPIVNDSSGNTYQVGTIQIDMERIQLVWNGSTVSVYAGNLIGYDKDSLSWRVAGSSGSNLYLCVTSNPSIYLDVTTKLLEVDWGVTGVTYSAPGQIVEDVTYNQLDSIEFFFANVSGGDAFTFTAPTGTFSCYNGLWKMNLAISLPYGFDYEGYVNVRMTFSNPSSSVNVKSLYYSFGDLAYTDAGTFDPNSGSLGEINQNMQAAADSLKDIAAQLEGIATEYTLGQCLQAVNNIYQYLSGNIYPLLNSMSSNISGIYGYMTGTMQGTLTSILTQIGNVVTAVNKAGSDIVSALEAQTAALIAYFESVFSKAGEDLDQTNDDLNNSITDFNQREDALTGDFNANWSSFDFDSYEVDASLGNAFTWVSGRFMDLWNALGTDVQLLITIPCVLGLGMMVVTGSSRYFGRARIGKEDDE